MMHVLPGALLAAMLAQAAGGSSAGSSGISGRVIDKTSGAPIAGARVGIVLVVETRDGSFGRDARQTTTDANGRFAFTSLTGGRYSLRVERNGYASYPDVLGGGVPPAPIDVAEGQSVDALEISLDKAAVFTGRILDASGEPEADVQVSAMRRTAIAGTFDFVPRQTGTTNDIGEFRLAGLPAGEYLIVAAPRQADPFASSDAPMTLIPTYYPGKADRSAAQVFTVVAGQTVGALSFSMATAPAVHVSGVVVDAAGNAVANATVMMMPSSMAGMTTMPQMKRTGADGAFRFDNVPPGAYNIRVPESGLSSGSSGIGVVAGGFFDSVEVGSAVAGSVQTGGAARPGVFAVTVGDRDVEGLRITAATLR
jgi:protocatechuate 3,4-dioxygenase beta subunit